jgi:hypothetical protein
MISSPCTKVCTIDAASRLCMGCGRSLEEIARWGGMSEAERQTIMRTLPERIRGANLKPPRDTQP